MPHRLLRTILRDFNVPARPFILRRYSVRPCQRNSIPELPRQSSPELGCSAPWAHKRPGTVLYHFFLSRTVTTLTHQNRLLDFSLPSHNDWSSPRSSGSSKLRPLTMITVLPSTPVPRTWEIKSRIRGADCSCKHTLLGFFSFVIMHVLPEVLPSIGTIPSTRGNMQLLLRVSLPPTAVPWALVGSNSPDLILPDFVFFHGSTQAPSRLRTL